MNNIIKFSFILLFLLLLQFALFNNIVVGKGVIVFVYILFILILPIKTPGWASLMSAFLIGLLVDSMFNTGGIHAFASVFIAFIRMPVLRSFKQTLDIDTIIKPSIQSMGFEKFIKYISVLIFIHNFIIYFLELFHFKMFFYNLLIVIINTVLTTFICIILNLAFKKGKSRSF